jgi:hypothetical protein
MSFKGFLSSQSWAFWHLLLFSMEGGSVRAPLPSAHHPVISHNNFIIINPQDPNQVL